MPRNLHIGLDRPNSHLNCTDILGAQPQCVKFTTNRIGHNPLNPTYKLQTVEYLAPEPTRYIKDPLHIDDIEGTRPQKKKQLDIATRDIMNIKDIEGTGANFGHQVKERNMDKVKNYNPMDYRDVTNVDFRTTRVVDPLNPTYLVKDDDNKCVKIGPVDGSIPVTLPPPRKDTNFVNTSLTTTDIHGCKTSTKGLGSFHTRERREVKKTNITSDIFGAQPDTLKKSPTTTRRTHPLMPDYQMPGRNEITDPNNGYGERQKKENNTLKNAAAASLGINEGSKLYSASRKGSEHGGSQQAASVHGS